MFVRKLRLSSSVLAVLLLVAPSPCFALWSIGQVSKERARELGMEIRSKAAGPNAVRVELEFETEGKLKSFSRVDLRINEGEKWLVTATLRENRSRPGRVVLSFAADRAHLDKITLWVMVPDMMPGGTIYELRVKDFVELGKRFTENGERKKKAPQNAAEQGGAGPPAATRSESK
ncbi:MAG: hypothetical protein ACYTG0_29825 [Planctomycetota bacterium]|jgi:hypothetical protein